MIFILILISMNLSAAEIQKTLELGGSNDINQNIDINAELLLKARITFFGNPLNETNATAEKLGDINLGQIQTLKTDDKCSVILGNIDLSSTVEPTEGSGIISNITNNCQDDQANATIEVSSGVPLFLEIGGEGKVNIDVAISDPLDEESNAIVALTNNNEINGYLKNASINRISDSAEDNTAAGVDFSHGQGLKGYIKYRVKFPYQGQNARNKVSYKITANLTLGSI
jgi:hypothetical protein